MSKTPDKTIYEKLVAFKYSLREAVKEFKSNGRPTYKFWENSAKKCLQELDCNVRFEDDVMAIGDTIVFKTKIFFFDASGEEISAQSIGIKSSDKDSNGLDTVYHSRMHSLYALIGMIDIDCKKNKNINLPEDIATMIYDEVYRHAYEQAKKDLEKDAEFPFSKVSEEKRTELMMENCLDPVQTPKIDCADEREMGGVPKGFKGFN